MMKIAVTFFIIKMVKIAVIFFIIKLYAQNVFAFYFMLEALFILKIFKFLFWSFGHAEIQFNEKAKVNFKIYDAIDWTASNHNTHIDQYLKK